MKGAKKGAPVVNPDAGKSVDLASESHKEEAPMPEFGFGKFEYVNQATYVGNWRQLDGKKMKHGHGKMMTPGIETGERAFGMEEYEGDWKEDKMDGYGRY